jgi:hypothetical protein
MSYQKLERRPASWWRARGATIGQMIDQGWVIWSVCGSCFLTMEVDLTVMEFMLGETETLWNRHPSCRRIGCIGVTTFHGVPPETNTSMRLVAEWPQEWAKGPPAVPKRVSADKRAAPPDRPAMPDGSLRPRR